MKVKAKKQNKVTIPTPYHNTKNLSLRDCFAVMALQGVKLQQLNLELGETPIQAVARLSYQIADAMVKERIRSELKNRQ